MAAPKRTVALMASLGAACALAHAGTVRATGIAEIPDPEGDVASTDSRHGLDLVKLVLDSDGTRLTISATLRGTLQNAREGSPVVLYVDTDNRADTGGPARSLQEERKGFEKKIELQICVEYYAGFTTCSGGSVDASVTAVYPAASVAAIGYTDKLVLRPSDAPRGKVDGDTYTAQVTYAALGVRSKATIRVLPREVHAKDDGLLSEVILTLN